MRLAFRYVLLVGLLLCLAWWKWPRPDTFLSDLSLRVPSEFIVSHQSPFMLMSVNDELMLRIPKSRVAEVQRIFAAQQQFEDVSSRLPRHYAEFRARSEKFFRSCPKRFQAGRFEAFDRERHWYACQFLFDQDDPNFTYLYLSSASPTN